MRDHASGGRDETWVELARVHDPAQASILRSVLEAAAIDHLVEGEQVQGLFPVATPGFFRDRGMGVVIRVRPEDLDDARQLLEVRAESLPEEPADEG